MAADDIAQGAKSGYNLIKNIFGKGKSSRSVVNAVEDAARKLPEQLTLFGKESADALKKDALGVIAQNSKRQSGRIASAATKVKKLPWWAKAGTGLGLGGLGYGIISSLGGKDTPSYDWAGKLNLPTPGATTTAEQSAMDDWLAKRTQAVKDAFAYTPTVPGSEMYNGMSAANNQLGAASMAAMNDLANQYGQGAATIKSRGAAAGQSINDIYGAGAGALEALGSQASGEYDAMTPVSGAAAVAPEQQRMAGQSLANYLTQNQLIDAQAQGGMAQLAQMLGPAYANQYALMDVQARAAADANKARTMAEYENNRQSQLAQALGELNMSAADAEYERRVKAAQAGSLPTPDPATLNEMAATWEALPQEEKNYYNAMAIKNGFDGGITDAYDWVNYQLQQQQQQLGL
jgi:hypothetical protein